MMIGTPVPTQKRFFFCELRLVLVQRLRAAPRFGQCDPKPDASAGRRNPSLFGLGMLLWLFSCFERSFALFHPNFVEFFVHCNRTFMFEIFFRALDIFVFFCCTSAFLTALSWLSKWQHQGKNVVEGWRG